MTRINLRRLIIGAPERELIVDLRRRAEAVPPVDAVKAVAQDAGDLREANVEFTIRLPEGYQVTFTYEAQPAKAPYAGKSLFKHLSVSVEAPMKAPAPAAVEIILAEFGMRPLIESDTIWTEQFDRNRYAVNVLQRVGRAQ
jgi:hypothetical protein